MNIGIITAIFLFSLAASTKDPSSKEVRLLYEQAAKERTSCKNLIALIKPFDEGNNQLLFGYKGKPPESWSCMSRILLQNYRSS